MTGWDQRYQRLSSDLATLSMSLPPFHPLEWMNDGDVETAQWGNVSLTLAIEGGDANLYADRSLLLASGDANVLRRDPVGFYNDHILGISGRSTREDTEFRREWATDLAKRHRRRSDLALVNTHELLEAVQLLRTAPSASKFLKSATKELVSRTGKSRTAPSSSKFLESATKDLATGKSEKPMPNVVSVTVHFTDGRSLLCVPEGRTVRVQHAPRVELLWTPCRMKNNELTYTAPFAAGFWFLSEHSGEARLQFVSFLEGETTHKCGSRPNVSEGKECAQQLSQQVVDRESDNPIERENARRLAVDFLNYAFHQLWVGDTKYLYRRARREVDTAVLEFEGHTPKGDRLDGSRLEIRCWNRTGGLEDQAMSVRVLEYEDERLIGTMQRHIPYSKLTHLQVLYLDSPSCFLDEDSPIALHAFLDGLPEHERELFQGLKTDHPRLFATTLSHLHRVWKETPLWINHPLDFPEAFAKRLNHGHEVLRSIPRREFKQIVRTLSNVNPGRPRDHAAIADFLASLSEDDRKLMGPLAEQNPRVTAQGLEHILNVWRLIEKMSFRERNFLSTFTDKLENSDGSTDFLAWSVKTREDVHRIVDYFNPHYRAPDEPRTDWYRWAPVWPVESDFDVKTPDPSTLIKFRHWTTQPDFGSGKFLWERNDTVIFEQGETSQVVATDVEENTQATSVAVSAARALNTRARPDLNDIAEKWFYAMGSKFVLSWKGMKRTNVLPLISIHREADTIVAVYQTRKQIITIRLTPSDTNLVTVLIKRADGGGVGGEYHGPIRMKPEEFPKFRAYVRLERSGEIGFSP